MLNKLDITRGRNDLLINSDGKEYIDFVTGFGAVLLGHGQDLVVERVRKQLQDIWITGRLAVSVIDEAANLVVSSLAQSYRHLQFYSSGNEAVEFAIRVATTATRRHALAGFDRSMHGKSIAASALCWQNDFIELKDVHTLPFVDSCTESQALEQLEGKLASRKIAAVFLELIQGTNGGHAASPDFYRAVGETCHRYGTLCVVDEVLTGFYRSGHLSYSRAMGLTPDILIFGKAMGNGFPISAVVCRPEIEVTDAMLPGSTFSNNPLGAAAVSGTLTRMQQLDMDALTASIDRAVRSEFAPLQERGVILRGNGALWVVELPDRQSALDVQAAALSAKVVLSAYGRYVRLFPPATISSANLRTALNIVSEACLETSSK